MTTLVLRGGRVIDPKQGVDRAADLVIRGGRIAEVIAPGQPAGNLGPAHSKSQRASSGARFTQPWLRGWPKLLCQKAEWSA